jgi:hypothetical protein
MRRYASRSAVMTELCVDFWTGCRCHDGRQLRIYRVESCCFGHPPLVCGSAILRFMTSRRQEDRVTYAALPDYSIDHPVIAIRCNPPTAMPMARWTLLSAAASPSYRPWSRLVIHGKRRIVGCGDVLLLQLGDYIHVFEPSGDSANIDMYVTRRKLPRCARTNRMRIPPNAGNGNWCSEIR